MRRVIVALVFALVAGAVGPRVVGLQSRSAGVPFAYEPPPGLVEPKAPPAREGTKTWIADPKGADAPEEEPFDRSFGRRPSLPTPNAVRVVLSHTSKPMSVEEAALARLVEEMPKAFEDTCTWTHRRHELRVRTDGARVGLIEGDCTRDVELGALGLPSQKVRARKLQLMFPDDEGTSILTASYPIEQAPRWEPLFEASIAKARGVASRVPAPPSWMYGAWGLAGAVVGWLGGALVVGGPGTAAPVPPQRSRKRPGADEDESEDEDRT